MAATLQLDVLEKDSTNLQGSIPDFDRRTLEEITRIAQHATSASGAALVLSDGSVMSCRASSGELGPPVGTRLNTDTGFTASCVRTAEVICCDDAETDSRVDGSSCVQLGIRSILAVPIFNGQNVAGVLEVLSNEPKKFTDRHATALRLLARLVETLANYVSRDDVSRDTLTPDAKPESDYPGRANIEQAKVTCLSCKHPNSRGSQFCNHCGAILFSFLGSQDTGDRGQPKEWNDDEGFKEICKIISGNAGQATWNEISEGISNQQSTAQDTPHVSATQEPTKTEAAAGTVQGNTGLKTRLGAAVRRNLWR